MFPLLAPCKSTNELFIFHVSLCSVGTLYPLVCMFLWTSSISLLAVRFLNLDINTCWITVFKKAPLIGSLKDHCERNHPPVRCQSSCLSACLSLSCRWVDISTWTPTPQGSSYLGTSPSVLDNSFFAESVLTSYNFLASLQIIFNLEHGQLKFLDNFLSIIYYLFSAGES